MLGNLILLLVKCLNLVFLLGLRSKPELARQESVPGLLF